MNSLEILEVFNFLPFRRANGIRTKPHLTLRFKDVDFHIDSSKGSGFNLITHAHSDHYGSSNMANPNAVASVETARILKATTSKKFSGITFKIGDTLNLGGIKIRTYPTEHMHGSTAFLIESETRVLVTGDVKDYRKLPKCDVLVTEATYGSPEHVFEDEIHKLVNEAKGSTFGVYPIGKAQRVASILLENGYAVKAEEKIERICRAIGIDVEEDGDVCLVSPRTLWSVRGKKYILTAQKFYRLPRIVISDHVDYEGLIGMIEHCDAEHVIFYHGKPSPDLLRDVKEMGKSVTLLNQLDRLSI